MLVAALAMYRAMGMQNQAAYNIMRTHDSMLSSLRSINGHGHPNFQGLYHQDVNNDIALAKNSIMYQAAGAMRDSYKAMLKDEIKNSFSIFA